MVEEMFKHVHGAETKQQDPKVLDILGLYQKAFTNPTPLTQRDLPVVTVSQDQWYTGAPASGPKNWSRITAKKGRAVLPKACRRLLKGEGVCIQDNRLRSASLDSSNVALHGISRGPIASRGVDLADPGCAAACSHYPHCDRQGCAGVVVSEVRHADMASDSGDEATHRTMCSR